ncbi:hypothetical protein JHK87_018704 [Glycine soja]|nr:hypothetical protein JHK87_018704 [Glycine soja]
MQPLLSHSGSNNKATRSADILVQKFSFASLFAHFKSHTSHKINDYCLTIPIYAGRCLCAYGLISGRGSVREFTKPARGSGFEFAAWIMAQEFLSLFFCLLLSRGCTCVSFDGSPPDEQLANSSFRLTRNSSFNRYAIEH